MLPPTFLTASTLLLLFLYVQLHLASSLPLHTPTPTGINSNPNHLCITTPSNVTACRIPNTHLYPPTEPIPQSFQQQPNVWKTSSKQDDTQQSPGFEATIIGDTTIAQRMAIDRCMNQASEWWPSLIVVDVLVNFSTVGGPRVLGSARPTSNWEIDGIIYPVALAEALTNSTLNSSPSSASATSSVSDQYDIQMTINSGARWFASTLDDGNEQPEPMTYDLLTVCLHELIHGLFMSGGNLVITKKDNEAYIASLFNPRYIGRFDSFMSDQNGCSIVKAYSNNSDFLGSSLTGNNLWFSDMNGDVIARLHAPKPYVSGTSLYHLSEFTYGAGLSGNNDLMTPIIGTSYSQHNIGDITRRILNVVFDTAQTNAKACENIGPPVEDETIIEGGGSNGDFNTPGGGIDPSNPSQGQSNGFIINLGTLQISGWIVVGGAIGIVLVIFTSAFVIRSIVISSSKKRKPPRLVPRPERVEVATTNNTTGIV